MKTILYMAITANGYIAKENDETPWSEEEWKSFIKMVKKEGNLIVGKRTYDIMKKNKEFNELSKIEIVVVTSKHLPDNIAAAAYSPRKALEIVESYGFCEALVAGGSQINSSFMKEGLIDEIYLDIEPILLGKGIKLFADEDFQTNLSLINVKKLSKNEVQLHYKVIK